MKRFAQGLSRLSKIGFVSLMLLLASACVLVQATPADPQGQRDAAKDQARLAMEVRHQLVTLPNYSVFDNLAYSVNGNKVILQGQVIHAFLKGDAATAVKSIEGVQSVDNQIQILPLSSADDQIRRAEYQAIYSFGGFQRYSDLALVPIHIIVANGHVTLEGYVDTQQDKDVATLRAKTVSSVFSVTNHLQIHPGK